MVLKDSFEIVENTSLLAIHTNDSVRLIEETSIVSVITDGHYCIIQTDRNEKFTTAKILRDFEEYFGKNSSFIRIGKSQMINVKKILKYSKGEPCIIEMINGQTFEVPRRKKPDVLAKL